MPKRKKQDDYEYIRRKIKKYKKKLERRRRRSGDSSSRSESEEREHEDTQIRSEVHALVEKDNMELLNGTQTKQPDDHIIILPELSKGAMHEVVQPDTPGASAVLNEVLPSSALCGEDSESANIVLDSTFLELLGEDPTVSCSYGPDIQKDLAVRLEHIATHGLTKEIKKELFDKYLIPGNCKLIDAPAMNPEMKVAISDVATKRDKNIEFRQKQNATAISCLGQVMTKLFASKNTDPSITKMVMDVQRILCDIQYHDSSVRRNFVLAALKKEMKDQIQNTKPDSLLFGQELGEILKAAKAVNKSGTELKVPAPKSFQHNKRVSDMRQNSTKNLNWRGHYPPRKPPNYPYHPKAKAPPPQSNNNRPYSSSKPSPRQQQHQPRSHR